MSVLEIEATISKLPISDVTTLAEWFTAYQEQLWDKQPVDDTKADRLDALIEEAREEIRQGKFSSLRDRSSLK